MAGVSWLAPGASGAIANGALVCVTQVCQPPVLGTAITLTALTPSTHTSKPVLPLAVARR